MVKHKAKERRLNTKFIYACALIVLFTIFSAVYVKGVIGTQFGWWHYYAWRMKEGDVLYKDIYLFMPPYFVFFTRLFYTFFSNHLIFYTIFVGYPIKIACLLLIYNMICRFTKPFFACMSVFFGACISASYMMDQWYDYNTILMLPALLVAYFIMKFYENRIEDTKRRWYSLYIGIIISLIFFSKQTFGVVFAVTALLMFIVLHLKEKLPNLRWTILYFIIGIYIGAFPAMFYLTKYNCWKEFFNCVFGVAGAKGGVEGLLTRPLMIFSDVNVWIIVMAYLLSVYIIKKMIYSRHELNIKMQEEVETQQKENLLFFSLSIVILSGAIVYLFHTYISQTINYANNSKGKYIFLVGGVIFLLLVLEERKKQIISKNLKYWDVVFEIVLFVSILIWAKLPASLHGTLYGNLSLVVVRRLFLKIFIYLGIVVWIKELYQYFFNTKGNYSVLMFGTIIVAHFFTGILSANELEEIYMVLYLPWVIAIIFNSLCINELLKNTVVLIGIWAGVLFSLSCKIYIPFDWQGWRELSITSDNVWSSVKGLEGISMPRVINQEIEEIVDIINQNTEDEDTVFQFGNMTLFNVLTQKKIPTYAVITWFDVCTDEIAEQCARELENDLPQMVVWHNMNEDEWELLESIFRNGQRSGQRKLQEFHDEILENKYIKLKEIDNNRDGTIEIWKLDK